MNKNLEVWPEKVLFNLRIQVMAPRVFPFVCIGKPYVCNVFRPSATWVGVATRTYKRDDLIRFVALEGAYYVCCIAISPSIIPSFTVLLTEKWTILLTGPSGEQGYESSHTLWWSPDIFFCLVCWFLVLREWAWPYAHECDDCFFLSLPVWAEPVAIEFDITVSAQGRLDMRHQTSPMCHVH